MAIRKKPIDYLKQPVEALMANKSVIGILLFLSATAAMIIANSDLSHWYFELWETEMTLSLAERSITMDLHHFINDGLMAIFFFLVGLEIKREFLAGELGSWRQASLPITAAIGGMVVPALIYLALNTGETAHGWGIPMATDIAFALGLINLVGRRVSSSTKVFLTSLAVVDDIGAVLVIAFFYTSSLHIDQLYFAGGAWVLLIIANRLGVRSVTFYSLVGIGGIWLSFFYSGIHPTIAGILLSFTIPSTTRITKNQFTDRLNNLLSKLQTTKTMDLRFNTHKEDQLLHGIRLAGDYARTPLQKIERGLYPLVYFVIMPIFAFANAGVIIEANFLELLIGPIGLGVMLGLIVGKIVGISLITRLVVALKISELPPDSKWREILGASIFAGIGFTMSLFISELAFVEPERVEAAKSAILVASVIAAIGGMLFIRFTCPVKDEQTHYDDGREKS